MKHELPGGAAWSAPARAGTLITLTALAADANASVLIIGADRLDRLNIPDTLKSQMSARIKSSMVLMSDRGTALATVIASSLDWHDCLGGFGPDARTGLISELTKHGFGAADLHGCINFFSKVGIDSGATLAFVPDHVEAGDNVVLRAEQDLLLFISTAPHPLSGQPWPPGGVAVEISADDHLAPRLELRDEAVRALEQTRWLVG